MNREEVIDTIFIICIIVAASALRLYNPFAIPYDYDEMGSIFRTHYNSISDLVASNMVIDVHPVGVQVFLYYWTKLVGETEFYVKLPFIVMGILTVLYVFKTGKDWFNSTVGLICAAYIATLEYPVMYSQEIRPYGIGLFFASAMAYHWSRIIFYPEKRYDLNWVLYVLFSACCAYTHYFCLMFAGIVGFTGIFFVNKRYVLRYIAAGIMIFALYIPHLHFFFYQLLNLKGGGWIPKPHNTFVLEYLQYVFHYSLYVYICVAALCCWGLTYSIIKRKFPFKYMLISFLWCVLPAAVGILYSVYRSPALEYNGLIFSFPFMLFFFFGLLPDVKSWFKVGIIGLLCAVNILTLIYVRRYYDIFYKSPTRMICALNDSVTKTIGKGNIVRFIEGDSSTTRMEKYYVRRYNYDSTYLYLDNTKDKTTLIDYLESHQNKFLSYGCLSEADVGYLPIFLTYYPYLVKRYDFFRGNFYMFSSQKGEYASPFEFESKEEFEGAPAKGWTGVNSSQLVDSVHFSGRRAYKMDSLNEYGPTFSFNLKDIISNKNDIIMISAEVYPLSDSTSKISMVESLECGDKVIYWSSSSVNDFITKGEKGRWTKVYQTLRLSDIYLESRDVQIKMYIWNSGKRNFYVDDLDVSAIKGNPYLYGVVYKIE
jgi:hypothetical protein